MPAVQDGHARRRADDHLLMTMGANFVVAVDIPTDRNPDYWVSMGAAMLCALAD